LGSGFSVCSKWMMDLAEYLATGKSLNLPINASQIDVIITPPIFSYS
jgi:hypothetical protein